MAESDRAVSQGRLGRYRGPGTVRRFVAIWVFEPGGAAPVTLSVHVYGLRFEREADFQIGIVGLIDRMFGQRLRLEVNSGSIAIVRPGEGTEDAGDSFTATLRALQSLGTASRMLSADVPSLNGTPAQFYELLKTAYLREVTSTITDTGTETTLRPGEISSGFSLSYTARITAPDEVLVRLCALRVGRNFTLFVRSSAHPVAVMAIEGARRRSAQAREPLIVSGFRIGRRGRNGGIVRTRRCRCRRAPSGATLVRSRFCAERGDRKPLWIRSGGRPGCERASSAAALGGGAGLAAARERDADGARARRRARLVSYSGRNRLLGRRTSTVGMARWRRC